MIGRALPYEEQSVWRRVAADFLQSRIATAGLIMIGLVCLLAIGAEWITQNHTI